MTHHTPSGHIMNDQEDRVNTQSGARARRRSKAVRRWTGFASLVLALALLGVGYSAFAPGGNTATTAAAGSVDTEAIAQGKALFDRSCISCHGANLQGVPDKGPALIGVGQANVYFQLVTGRMPAKANGSEMPRAIPFFRNDDGTTDFDAIHDISAYIESMGGGATLPDTIDLADADYAKGSELYRLNCASCHNFTGKGGALSQGKWAPPLDQASNKVIYAAMLAGPENMPTFSNAQLTHAEKLDIIKYVRGTTEVMSPGGYGLGGFGPVSEGLIAFIVGMGVIVSITLWSGSRS